LMVFVGRVVLAPPGACACCRCPAASRPGFPSPPLFVGVSSAPAIRRRQRGVWGGVTVIRGELFSRRASVPCVVRAPLCCRLVLGLACVFRRALPRWRRFDFASPAPPLDRGSAGCCAGGAGVRSVLLPFRARVRRFGPARFRWPCLGPSFACCAREWLPVRTARWPRRYRLLVASRRACGARVFRLLSVGCVPVVAFFSPFGPPSWPFLSHGLPFRSVCCWWGLVRFFALVCLAFLPSFWSLLVSPGVLARPARRGVCWR